MKTSIKKQVIDFAERYPNQESCGLFYINFNTFSFYPCKNISQNPKETFEISTDDFLKVENIGTICGIFHSHINEDSEFSKNDKNCAEEADLPIFCYSLLDKKIKEFRPNSYKSNLYQREFIWGANDCYSIIRDYYWNNFQYLMDDFDRDDDFEQNNSSIILDNFQNQKFYIPENQIDIKEHDILLYKSVRFAYPHHFEIYIGNSKVLQHLKNRLSGKDMISEGFFKKRYKILRFQDFNLKRDTSLV